MRVTIAIDDISLPLPQMRRPDIRERLLNQILQTLADYGVDDVHLIIATSLHRRMTENEIRRMVGERAFKQFLAGSAIQLRWRESGRDCDAGQDRLTARKYGYHARSGIRPADLSEYQPGADGRRAQVGGGGPGALPEPAPSS